MKPTRRQWWRSAGYALAGLCVGLVVVLLLSLVVKTTSVVTTIRGTQETNTQITRTNAETLRIIKSCTTPGQSCYDRGQKATAGAVASINRVVILAAACASQHRGESVARVQTCVLNRLADRKGKP